MGTGSTEAALDGTPALLLRRRHRHRSPDPVGTGIDTGTDIARDASSAGTPRGAFGTSGAGDDGFSMIATMLSLVAVALLALVLMSTTLHSGSPTSTNVAGAPGVGQADDLAAQQSLSTALTAVDGAAAGAGGYGALTAATLSASDPSVTYVSGTTTSASAVSIALTAGGSGNSGNSGGSRGSGGSTGAGSPAGGAVGAAISGAEAAGAAGTSGAAGAAGTGSPVGGSGVTGTVTLATHSSSGTCWLVWRGDGSAIWYGAQTDLPNCTAPALASAPSAGPVSSSSIGWQQGRFPAP